VVEKVARKEGVSPTELSPPLNDVVDTDALDTLVRSSAESDTRSMHVEFEYRDYVVRVRDGPTVSVSPVETEAPTDALDYSPDARVESGE
jgi:hypothetical protein